jgi:hypothetical protein
MTRTIAALATIALLGGCAHHRSARADGPAPVAAVGATCNVDLLKVLVGRPGSAVLAAQALDLSGAQSVRWMHPGDMVTMDIIPDRLNIKLTRANMVKSFACG